MLEADFFSDYFHMLGPIPGVAGEDYPAYSVPHPPPSSVLGWCMVTMLTRSLTASRTTSVGRGGGSSPPCSVLMVLSTTSSTSSVIGGSMWTVLWLVA